jgi:hypothetical protein
MHVPTLQLGDQDSSDALPGAGIRFQLPYKALSDLEISKAGNLHADSFLASSKLPIWGVLSGFDSVISASRSQESLMQETVKSEAPPWSHWLTQVHFSTGS